MTRDPHEVASLCRRRERARRDRTVEELLREDDGEDWATQYVIAVIRVAISELKG